MSKSALYAGLGAGLSSFGQSVGQMMQAMTLEELREKNLREKWARQDKLRSEDMAYQKSRDAVKDQQAADQLNATKAQTEGLLGIRKNTLDETIRSNKADEENDVARIAANAGKNAPERKANWKSYEDLNTGELVFYDANSTIPKPYTETEFRALGKSQSSPVNTPPGEKVIQDILAKNPGWTEDKAKAYAKHMNLL